MARVPAASILLLVMVVAAACAARSVAPAAPPPPSSLEDFLQTSPAAQAIAAAAAGEAMLSSSAPRVEQVRVLMTALEIRDLAALERRLAARSAEAPALIAALKRRLRGSKSGDVAHWVAVALVAFDPARRPADVSGLRDLEEWDDVYLASVLELRDVVRRGQLREAAVAAAAPGRGALVPAQVLQLPLEPAQLPEAVVRRAEAYWPVFGEPGGQAIRGIVALEREAVVRWSEHRFLAREAGTARTWTELHDVPLFRRRDDGALAPLERPVAVEEGRELSVAMVIPGHGLLAWWSDTDLALLPADCCRLESGPEGDWWLRLAAGGSAGGWIQAPGRVIGLRFPAMTAMLEEMRERSARSRLGRLGSGGTLDVEGAHLLYWVEGDAAAASAERPPLVVLHGGPGIGSAYLRGPMTDLLAPERALLFYDQRGSGYSSGAADPGRLTMDWFVSDLDALRRGAEVESIDLLAHSFGGLLALHYALEHPERVRRIVLIDPDPATRAGWETFRARVDGRTRLADAEELGRIEATSDWADDPELFSRWFEVRLRAYVADPERAPAPEIRFDEVVLPAFRTTSAALRGTLGDWDLLPVLSRIEAPVLVLAPTATVFEPAELRRLAEALGNGELLTLREAGHFPFGETPEAFRQAVLEFLGR